MIIILGLLHCNEAQIFTVTLFYCFCTVIFLYLMKVLVFSTYMKLNFNRYKNFWLEGDKAKIIESGGRGKRLNLGSC